MSQTRTPRPSRFLPLPPSPVPSSSSPVHGSQCLYTHSHFQHALQQSMHRCTPHRGHKQNFYLTFRQGIASKCITCSSTSEAGLRTSRRPGSLQCARCVRHPCMYKAIRPPDVAKMSTGLVPEVLQAISSLFCNVFSVSRPRISITASTSPGATPSPSLPVDQRKSL